MRHTYGEGVLVLALFAALIACADPAGRTVGPAGSKDIVTEPTPAPASEERVALTRIARLVAVAMDNEPARQRLKRDMRSAPFHEHKLQLTSYLRSKDGRALLEGMAARTGGGENAVFGALAAIRPLEFYMPVVKHRESWTGKGDILVVSQLDEAAAIVAFDERGREVSLDRNVAPDQPTLSIVPVETRFDQPMGPAASRNVRDQSGDAIGTLADAQQGESNVAGSAPRRQPAAFWLFRRPGSGTPPMATAPKIPWHAYRRPARGWSRFSRARRRTCNPFPREPAGGSDRTGSWDSRESP